METTSSIKLLKMTEKDDKEEKEVEMYWKEEQTSVACYGMSAKFLTPFHIYILEQIFFFLINQSETLYPKLSFRLQIDV